MTSKEYLKKLNEERKKRAKSKSITKANDKTKRKEGLFLNDEDEQVQKESTIQESLAVKHRIESVELHTKIQDISGGLHTKIQESPSDQ
ncbi:hypothetical protein JCGZ_13693 [Jatropha curcas]|uniref:Uncharacterized protein n=1 Tax=Jatropha curcas TaxID=180498 RepID=A0A067K9W8_JATCU|nr:hypothetical protein JCGZ_13693 [Jatropha curcas]